MRPDHPTSQPARRQPFRPPAFFWRDVHLCVLRGLKMAFAVKAPVVRNCVFFSIALTVVFLPAAEAQAQRANPQQAKMSALPKLASPATQSSEPADQTCLRYAD